MKDWRALESIVCEYARKCYGKFGMLFVGRLWRARRGKIVLLTMGEMYGLCHFPQGSGMFSTVKDIRSTDCSTMVQN
jgi:hypothetical protein